LHRLVKQIKRILRSITLFSEKASKIKLRRYQKSVARCVVNSVLNHQGLSIVVMFPRQSGKNELQAQIETYLMTVLSERYPEMVKVSPTWKPQSLNAMHRLERTLSRNLFTKGKWSKEAGYIFRLGTSRISFFSGQPEANIVGASATALLEVDEAQDVTPAKYDKDIAPMAASTNATRVFWGTAWTSRSLLARELRAAQAQEKEDGIKRTFVLDAVKVGREVPAYKVFVEGQVRRLGRNNPMVRTQYFSEEIDAEGGLFPPGRIALMHGAHEPQHEPQPGSVYAFCIDVAGEDEAETDITAELHNPGRDSTALTIVEIDTSTIGDEIIRAPTYKVVNRMLWTGTKHTRLYSQIRSLADTWSPRYIAIDSTGVGAGLSSFLDKAFPGRVVPYLFNAVTKSDLAWNFITVVDSGRYKEHSTVRPLRGRPLNEASERLHSLSDQFFHELQNVAYEIQPGPAKKIKWGVPDGTRNSSTGELIHDDLVLSAALVGALDTLEWALSAPTIVIPFPDPLAELDKGF